MFVPAWPPKQLWQFISSQWFVGFVYFIEVHHSVLYISVEQQIFSFLQNGGCFPGACA